MPLLTDTELPDHLKKGLHSYICLGQSQIEFYKQNTPPLLQEFDDILEPFYQIVKHADPGKWGVRFARQLRKLTMKNLSLPIKQFLMDYLPLLWDILRTPIREGSIPRTAIHNIHYIQKQLPLPPFQLMSLLTIDLDDLPKHNPTISIRRDEKITWLIDQPTPGTEIKIPLIRGVFHKGGAPRLILKRIFGSCLIEKEVPIKDWDILVTNLQAGENFMTWVGEKDLSGIELFNKDNLEFIFSCRDVTINLCILGLKGFIYTKEGREAAETGIIYPCGGDHGIYGKDRFIHQDHEFFKPRVFERLLKFVIEGKAKSFRIKEENLQLFLGISLLLAIVRMIGKKDCFERLEKLYYLLEQMGQLAMYHYVFANHLLINSRRNNIFDLLENTHRLYPFVTLENRGQDEGVARWLIRKLLKWFRREFRNKYQVFDTNLSWLQIDPQEEYREFSLENFRSDKRLLRNLARWFPGYLQRCLVRNELSEEKD